MGKVNADPTCLSPLQLIWARASGFDLIPPACPHRRILLMHRPKAKLHTSTGSHAAGTQYQFLSMSSTASAIKSKAAAPQKHRLLSPSAVSRCQGLRTETHQSVDIHLPGSYLASRHSFYSVHRPLWLTLSCALATAATAA